MKSRTPVVLAVIVLVLAVFYVVGAARLREAHERLDSLMVQAGPSARLALLQRKAASERQRATRKRIRAQLAGETASAESEEAVEEADKGSDKPAMQRLMEAAFSRLKDSEMFQNLLRTQASAQVDAQFAALFRMIDPANVDPLADLLRQKFSLGIDTFLAMQDDQMSSEERDKIFSETSEREKEIDDAIRELLSDEEFIEYEQYMDTLPDRQQVSVYKDKLYSAGLELSAEQEEAMIDMMYESRLAAVTEAEDPELYGISRLLPEERELSEQDIMIMRVELYQRRYLAGASEILGPAELELFAEYLHEMLNFQETFADFMPQEQPESHDRADVTLGGENETLSAAVSTSAGTADHITWSDGQGGSRSTAETTDGGMLLFKAEVGSGWGSGISFVPQEGEKNADGSYDAGGATRLVARMKAPDGIRVRFGMIESGADWPNADSHAGEKGADGEAFRHPGIETDAGWQVYAIPLSELKLNGGFGNQGGNRKIDMQAVRHLEMLVPGGQPDCEIEIDWLRLE